MRYDSLTEAVRLLGCFTATIDIQPIVDGESVSDNYQMFEEFFYSCKESKLVLQTSNGLELKNILLNCELMQGYSKEKCFLGEVNALKICEVAKVCS